MEINNNPNIVDSDLASFRDDVITASSEQLVLVDFWADWCGPCKSLTPILETLVAQYGGKLKLVKIDTEKHQDIAAQFGIRSLPTVFFFYRGEPVDQFMGLQPEPAIREKIDKYLGNETNSMLQQAIEAYDAGQQDAAIAFVQQLVENEPSNEEAKLQLLQWLTLENRMEEAKLIADSVSESSQTSKEFKGYTAKLEFIESLGEIGDIEQLSQLVAADSSDLESRYQLALALIAQDRVQDAMEQLLEIIRQNRTFRDDEPRKTMIKIFEMLGGKGELVSHFRGQLARILN